jgi:hypothetical protein
VTVPLFAGIVLGLIVGVALFFAYVVIGSALMRYAGTGCAASWVMRGYFIVVVLGCLAAIVAGVRAGTRGNTGIAALIIISAVLILAPATLCSASVAFGPCAP